MHLTKDEGVCGEPLPAEKLIVSASEDVKKNVDVTVEAGNSAKIDLAL